MKKNITVAVKVERIADARWLSIRFIYDVVGGQIVCPAFDDTVYFVREGREFLSGKDVLHDYKPIVLKVTSHVRNDMGGLS